MRPKIGLGLSGILSVTALASVVAAGARAQDAPPPADTPAPTAPAPTAPDPAAPDPAEQDPAPGTPDAAPVDSPSTDAPAPDADAPPPSTAPAPQPVAPAPPPGPAPAPTAPPPPLESSTGEPALDPAALEPQEQEEEIIVTGSRIKRSVFSTTAPVAVMTRQDIEQTGASNMADLLQSITAASGGGFQGANAGESLGTTRVNLRGFGGAATLVLLNGRRTVPSAAGVTVPFTDISTIPVSVVERIEILKSGASAIYGTDAIAGVVNIITRKDWEGLKVQLDGRATTKGFDYREGTASASIGAAAEDARVIVGLQYYRANQLIASDRDWSQQEGPPGGQGGNWSLIGQPGSYSVGGLPTHDPACDDVPGSRVEDLGAYTLCGFQFNDYRALTPELERASVYAYGEYDLSDYTKAFLEANVSRTRATNISSPSFRVLGNPVVPADHIDNPFNADAVFVGRPLGAAAGGEIQSNDDDTFRMALGMQGEFAGVAANTYFEDWGWEVVTTFGVSRYQRFLPDELAGPFQDALNSCADPSDLSGCFNPFHSAITGDGTPNSQDVIRSFTSALMSVTDQYLQTYGAGLNGSLADLPGGSLGFALGAEVRREQRAAQLDHDSNEFDLSFYFGDDDAYADRDILAGYLELLWPIVDGLELQTAARAEHYSEDWTTFNPFAGVVINPGALAGSDAQALTGLRLRGNVSRAFRAPALFQSFNGSTVIPQSIDVGGPSPVYVPIRREGNPDLEPERATVFSAGFSWQPVDELVLEFDYWNYAYENYIVAENPQAIVSQDAMDPRLEYDAIGVLQRVNTSWINLPGDVNTHGMDISGRFALDAGGAGTFSLGADFMLMLAFEIPKQDARTGLWVVPDVPDGEGDTEAPPFCDGNTCDVAGNFNEATVTDPLPTWRLNVPLTWQMDEHLAGFILHVTSPLEDWSPARFDEASGTGSRDIDAFITLDFQYALTLGNVLGRLTKLRVGVINLLDQDPPFVDTTDSFSTQLHDPRGRMVYASLAQEL